jgi:hypothetical protein
VSPVRYELGFYIPEDGILHSHRRENLRSHILYFYTHLKFQKPLFRIRGGLKSEKSIKISRAIYFRDHVYERMIRLWINNKTGERGSDGSQ